MDKKIEKFCEKIGLGIAISIIIMIILFFNINEVAFGEIILYDTVPNYKIKEEVKNIFNKEEYIMVSNIENTEEIGDIELIGVEDISYEHQKTDEEVEKSNQTSNNNNIDLEKLQNLDYLRQEFYIVDASTGMSKDYFNVTEFLNTDLKIEKNGDEPKVLIFHTHPHEMFKDSNTNDINEGIVGVGAKLANILEEYGIKTLHITDSSFDMENGSLQRNGAYERMEPVIKKVLEENPSIEMVIDLHRDGVSETTHLVETINGKQTAKIMFFNGISRIMENGKLNNISNLPNPYVKTNLALSFNMQKQANEKYPGLTRKIYIKPYRYSLHLSPKTMLVEAGAQTNTKQELYNAMEILAELINDVVFS